jgi:4-amino-4-deoxy-L-arabinose transferase-like glycosyltransferase
MLRSRAADPRSALLLAWLLLGALTLVAFLARPLTPIDETRYVSVAWEMWLRGDFLVPFKNGEPYSHKPPLMMWLFQLGWLAFGVNDVWPRLVSPLFSAVGLALTLWLARRLWPERPVVGARAVLMLAASLAWIVFSTSAMFDVILAVFVLVGMHAVLIAADGRSLKGFALLGVAIGLGVLTKGPVILLHVLPVAVLAPWWNPGLAWRRWYAGIGGAVLLGAVIALAWAIPAGLAGGAEYRNAIFWGQTANRMVESFAHRRPVWWYLPLLPLLLYPWFVWPALWRALAGTLGTPDRGSRFCLAWMLPVFIAFSLISGKQVHYLVPLIPAFVLLAARALPDPPGSPKTGLPALLAVLAGAALLVIALGGYRLPHDEFPALPDRWPAMLLIAAGIASGWAGRRTVDGVVNLTLLGAVLAAAVQLSLVRSLYDSYDVRPLASAIHRVQQSGHAVAHIGKYHAQYQFLGRLTQPLIVLDGAAAHAWLTAHPDAYAVVYVSDTRRLAGVPTLVWQRYRGEAAALVDAPTALRLLAQPRTLDTGGD